MSRNNVCVYGALLLSLLLCCVKTSQGNRSYVEPDEAAPSTPNRRFYFYNPELISHAAATIGMFAQPTIYKPIQPIQPIQPIHITDYGTEEEEEDDSHDHKAPPSPIQLLTFLKPNKKVKKVKKNKKNKAFNKIKKFSKKCLPFKLRIFRKSDEDEDTILVPYGYPEPGNGTELRVMRPKSLGRPHSWMVRTRRPFKQRVLIRPSRRPWPMFSNWKVAPPGRTAAEYQLKEPNPGGSGGSPPPSPLFNSYKDNRIPISESLLKGEVPAGSTHVVSSGSTNVAGGSTQLLSNASHQAAPSGSFKPIPDEYIQLIPSTGTQVIPNYVHMHSNPTGEYHEWNSTVRQSFPVVPNDYFKQYQVLPKKNPTTRPTTTFPTRKTYYDQWSKPLATNKPTQYHQDWNQEAQYYQNRDHELRYQLNGDLQAQYEDQPLQYYQGDRYNQNGYQNINQKDQYDQKEEAQYHENGNQEAQYHQNVNPEAQYHQALDQKTGYHQSINQQAHVTPTPETTTGKYVRYSEPDYFRYGIYDNTKAHQPLFVTQSSSWYQKVPQTETPGATQKYSQGPVYSTEKVITVTPTTSWVPLLQYHQSSEPVKLKEAPEKNFVSGGFRNSTASYNFGDKITVPRNCTTGTTKEKCKTTVSRRRAKPKGGTTSNSTTTKTYHSRIVDRTPESTSEKFYVEEIVPSETHQVSFEGRSRNDGDDIVTARYAQDDPEKAFEVKAGKSSRGRRSSLEGFVVTSSMVVEGT